MATISKLTVPIAGLPVHVYTDGELAKVSGDVAVLFFLHGRGGSALDSAPNVEGLLNRIAQRQAEGKQARQLVVATFDQRNHGERLVAKEANSDWIRGNNRHAIDMHGLYVGTAKDVSFLIDYLPSYIFPNGEAQVVQWLVAGKSLGGHATWYQLSHEPRVTLGIPIIGCIDYLRLISERARTSNIPFEPPYAPKTFVDNVKATDPAHLPYSASDSSNPFLGKKILVLSGGVDTLVPYAISEETVNKLNVGPSGVKKVIVYPDVGHACTETMISESADFIWEESLKA